MAFELFRRAGVTAAVIEVASAAVSTPPTWSRAGRGDTSIALDHQQYLGETVERIAFEKAGIIKPGMAVVAGARRRRRGGD